MEIRSKVLFEVKGWLVNVYRTERSREKNTSAPTDTDN